MDKKEEFKVAVASTDGIVVNSHFGKAATFYIYKKNPKDNTWKLVERRLVPPVCEGGEHDDARLQNQVKKFSDCKYILISRIGLGAAQMLEQNKIYPLELPGLITESLEQLVMYEKLQQLLEHG